MDLIYSKFIYQLNSQHMTGINFLSWKNLLLIITLIVCALSACPHGEKDNGQGTCIFSTVPCAMDFHDNGLGTECITVNGTCADGYVDDAAGDKCVLNCTAEEKNNGDGVCVGLDQPCVIGYQSSDPTNPNANCNNCSLDFKFDGFQSCVPLNSHCARGFKDNGQGVCILFAHPCAPGYISNNKSSNTNCFACDTAHGYRDDGEACSPVTDPCSFGFKDDGNGSCIFIYFDCANGYIDDGTGNCILQSSGDCGPNFVDDGNGECLLVIEIHIMNFFFKDSHNKPGRCDPTCARCVAGGNCSQCNVGYALDSTTKKCVYCGGCQACSASNTSQCTSCFAPQVINITSKTCVDVTCTITNCQQCNLDSTCKFCAPNYRLTNNTCQQCADQNCFYCSANASVCDSTGCNSGFIFSSQTKKCLPCATGCQSCKTTDVSDCVGVNPGYYSVVESGKTRAKRCFTNCEQCSSATKCIQCISNYIASTDGTQCLLKCSQSCYTCASNNPDNCTSCYSGTNLNSATGVCQPDLSCNSTSSCVAYVNGYVIQSGKYYQCTYGNGTNCVSCAYGALGVCTKCLSGYYLKDAVCKACSGNCISCLGSKSCFACADGYYLRKGKGASTGQCKPCDSSCLTCSDNPYVCTSCLTNYTWDGSSCISIHKVTLSLKLAVSIQNFINYYQSLIQWIVSQVLTLRPGRSFSRRQIVFKTVVSGSVNIGAEISMDDPSGVNNVAEQLTTTMNSGSATIDGLVISGSAVGSEANTTNTNTDNTTTTTTPSSTPNTLGIILGVVIPLGILILIAIIVVIVKVYNRREPEYELKMEDSHRNQSGKHFNSEDKNSEKV